MKTLLLRLAAPLQSWGDESIFETRNTWKEPSKSAVIGLIAAALGRSREDNIDDLCGLRFGVRTDQSGDRILIDFHTARNEDKKADSYVTRRAYLQDAVFLAGIEGENELISKIEHAIQNPAFPLYLGRRSCPPTLPLSLGVRDCPVDVALETEPWVASPFFQKKNKNYTPFIYLDSNTNEEKDFTRWDVPITFSREYRKHGFRGVKAIRLDSFCNKTANTDVPPDEKLVHDPISEL